VDMPDMSSDNGKASAGLVTDLDDALVTTDRFPTHFPTGVRSLTPVSFERQAYVN